MEAMMSPSSDTESIKNMLGLHNADPAEVLLARMDERLKSLSSDVHELKAAFQNSKTPWWQYWAPIAFLLSVVGGTYLKFDSEIRALERVDQTSMADRETLQRDIDKLEKRLDELR
jgi:hypothetical protein